MKRSIFCIVISLWSAAVLASCAAEMSPPPVKLQDLPQRWSESVAVGGAWPDAEWWRQFNSPELDRLISTAKAANLDLAAAAARVLQSEAQARIARAALFPTVQGNALVQNQGSTSRSIQDSTLAALGAQVAYEFDFWGLARSNIKAAQALLQSAHYAGETVALTVTTDVADSYFQIITLRERIAVASQNLAIAQRIVDAIQVRNENGLSSPLDLAQQQALTASQAAEIPALQQQEKEAVYRLSTLLSRTPEGFSVAGESLTEIVIPALAPGLPSELMTRRPDIAQAEANLIAANANIQVARAAFFPAISLSASGALTGGAIPSATNLAVGELSAAGGAGLIYTAGASLVQTIFDAGRREGQLDLAKAQQEELVANYRTAVVKAFSEVENALNQTVRLADQEMLKRDEVEKAARAFDISDVEYREGLIDVLAVLQSQQTLFAAQDQLLQVRLARFEAAIGLYKAFGGGWSQTTERPIE